MDKVRLRGYQAALGVLAVTALAVTALHATGADATAEGVGVIGILAAFAFLVIGFAHGDGL